MPLVVVDVLKGKTDGELTELLEAVHQAVVEAFQVPPRDRYQILQEHGPASMVIEDTGLGIDRSPNVVVVRVTSRPRTQKQKENLYRLLRDELQRRCGIEPSDVVVAVTENTDADWSFGHGRAQFLTGDL